MKVRASSKRFVTSARSSTARVVRVICSNPKHKQRQGRRGNPMARIAVWIFYRLSSRKGPFSRAADPRQPNDRALFPCALNTLHPERAFYHETSIALD